MQINVSNGGIIVSGGALYQYVLCEPSKTYTAAICLSDGTIICSSGVPSENGIGDYNTLWVDRNDDNLMFRIGFDAIEHKYVWAALYEGAYTADTLPPYVPKGYAAELAECMRYYQKFQTLTGTGASAAQRVFVVLPVVMRIMPTISYELLSGAQPQNVIAQARNVIDVTGATSYSHLSVSLSADL